MGTLAMPRLNMQQMNAMRYFIYIYIFGGIYYAMDLQSWTTMNRTLASRMAWRMMRLRLRQVQAARAAHRCCHRFDRAPHAQHQVAAHAPDASELGGAGARAVPPKPKSVCNMTVEASHQPQL